MSNTAETTLPQSHLIKRACQICYHKLNGSKWLVFPDGSSLRVTGELSKSSQLDDIRNNAEEFASTIERFELGGCFVQDFIYPHGGTSRLVNAVSQRDREAIAEEIAKLPADEQETLTNICEQILELGEID